MSKVIKLPEVIVKILPKAGENYILAFVIK